MISHGIDWHRFYFLLVGFAVFNCLFSGFAFRKSPVYKPPLDSSKTTVLKKSFADRATLLTAVFIFAYQGVEVANSGWIVSFLIENRDGVPEKVGNVPAGFWAGQTPPLHSLSRPAY
jgi:fucose permease